MGDQEGIDMNLEQIAGTLQDNWEIIGAVLVAVLVIASRVRSGDWRGALRLLAGIGAMFAKQEQPKTRITKGKKK